MKDMKVGERESHKIFRWDCYFRCLNPDEFKLQLPSEECQMTVYTARSFEKWYWGYRSELFDAFCDCRRPRVTNTSYGSEREAKYAAIEYLIDCINMAMYKVDNECWCKRCIGDGEILIGWEDVMEILEKVKDRLKEYKLHHDEDVLFDM